MRLVGRDELQPADHIYTDRKGGRLYHHGIYVGKCKVSNPENGEEKEIGNAVIHFFGHGKRLRSDQQCGRCSPRSKNGEEKEKEKEKSNVVTQISAFTKVAAATSQRCERCFPQSQNCGVCITCLDCFLGGHSLYVYEYHVCYLKLLFKQSGTCTVHLFKPSDEVIQKAFALLKDNSFGKYNFFHNNCEDFATYCKTGKPTSNQVAGNFYGFCLCGIVTYNAEKHRNNLPHFCLPFCGALSIPCHCLCKYGTDICCHLCFDRCVEIEDLSD